MADGIFFVRQGTVNNYVRPDIAFDSRLDHIKIQPDNDPSHIGILEYSFGSSHDDGEFTIFEVEHNFGYTPSAIVRRQTKGTDIQQYLTVVVSEIAPFKEWVFYYRCTDTKLEIVYKQTTGTVGNPYANTTQQFIYELYANPGNELVTL